MASNILVEKAKEQNIQILQFQNQKLSEQLANLKNQISVLDGSVFKFEEQKKQYADTLLCVNRIWEQLIADVRSLCARCSSTSSSNQQADPAAAAAAATSSGSAPADTAVDDNAEDQGNGECEPWQRFDPFLRRLLSNCDAEAAAALKTIKRNSQDYQADLSEVEQALHARSAASLQALAKLLQLIQDQASAAEQQHQQLQQLAADDALKEAYQQLQQQVDSLQQQLDLAQALQRSTQQLLKQVEDRNFEVTENLKSIKNDLADKEYALQAAQRKLQRLKQQQSGPAAGDQGSLPALGPGPRQSSPGVSLAGQSSGGGEPGAAGIPGGIPGGASSQENQSVVDELHAQLNELQELLHQRTAEQQAEAAAHSKTKQELVEACARIESESCVSQSGLYQLAQQQLTDAAQQLEARGKAVAAIQHERDELLRHFEAKTTQMEMEKVLRSKIGALQQQVDELNAKQVELLSQKQQLQLVHRQEMARYGNAKTVAELQSMLTALQKVMDVNANHARKAAEASAAADAARQDALAARTELSAAQSLAKSLQARLSAKAAELSGLSAKEEELKEQLNDLGAFVEVLTSFTSDRRDLLEVRRSEAQLKTTVAELSSKLKSSQLQQQLAAASAAEARLRQEAEATAAELFKLQGEVSGLGQQVTDLQAEITKKQAEADAFAQEIGEAYNAFEEQRQQNNVLLEQLAERDAAAATAQADRLKLEHQLAHLNEQLATARVELGTLRCEVAQMVALKEATDKDFGRVSAELAGCREQLLGHVATIDQLKTEVKAREDDKAAAQLLLEKERASAAARARAAEDDAAVLTEERAKRQRLEEENKMLTGKVNRLAKNANTSEAVQELEEEITALKRLIKCNVCDTRMKDVIITKCWHMFCKQCINKNLEARHRKCPGCGHPFGAADVKQFFFT